MPRRSAAGRVIRVGTLLTGMRHAARSRDIAELAVRHREDGVVGFDIAGAEAGFPPSRHLDAFEYLHRENVHVTIHAGEAFGLPSQWEAVQVCGTDRLGHGSGSWATSPARRARPVRPTSVAEYPITLLKDLRFRVTVNTDNRLMSGTSMTQEMQSLASEAGWTLAGLRWVTINTVKSAFIPFDERLALIEEVVKPGYAALGAP